MFCCVGSIFPLGFRGQHGADYLAGDARLVQRLQAGGREIELGVVGSNGGGNGAFRHSRLNHFYDVGVGQWIFLLCGQGSKSQENRNRDARDLSCSHEQPPRKPGAPAVLEEEARANLQRLNRNTTGFTSPSKSQSQLQKRRAGAPAPHMNYWVTVFTASPVLNPVPETVVATAEISSTSVTFTTPTVVAMRRITLPDAGSLISRLTRSTFNWSPTFTPAFAPTLRMICPPSTAAISPSTTMVRVTSLSLPAITWVLVCSTAAFTASPMMVCWKSLLPKSALPPPNPCQLPPPPSSEVLSRCDSPLPSATATIALDFLCPNPPRPKPPRAPPAPPRFMFLVSLPNCVMLPTTIASTPSSFPILDAVVRLSRSRLEKFCSAMILSRALRSITE